MNELALGFILQVLVENYLQYIRNNTRISKQLCCICPSTRATCYNVGDVTVASAETAVNSSLGPEQIFVLGLELNWEMKCLRSEAAPRFDLSDEKKVTVRLNHAIACSCESSSITHKPILQFFFDLLGGSSSVSTALHRVVQDFGLDASRVNQREETLNYGNGSAACSLLYAIKVILCSPT